MHFFNLLSDFHIRLILNIRVVELIKLQAFIIYNRREILIEFHGSFVINLSKILFGLRGYQGLSRVTIYGLFHQKQSVVHIMLSYEFFK